MGRDVPFSTEPCPSTLSLSFYGDEGLKGGNDDMNDGMVDDYNFGAAIGIALNGTMINFKPDHSNENVFITILRQVTN